MSSHDEDSRRPSPLRRRDFLALGSLAVLTPAMPALFARAAGATTLAGAERSPASETASAVGAGPAPPPTLPLSVGYLEGSELLQNLRKLAPDLRDLTVVRRGGVFTAGRRMLPAHSYPSGDPRLVGGPVRMTIHDLYPRTLPEAAAAARWPVAIDLDVLVPLLDPPRGSTARFEAWSYRRLPAEDRSATVSFLVWPDWFSDLSVVLRVVPPGANSQPRLLQARFTLGADPGRPRLQKGIYLLGLDRGTWEEEVDLPDDPAQVPAELTSVLLTVEPEGIRRGSR